LEGTTDFVPKNPADSRIHSLKKIQRIRGFADSLKKIQRIRGFAEENPADSRIRAVLNLVHSGRPTFHWTDFPPH
jgi:hypothetical protein